jgi:CubicO group peptidase (beta-lactamase class C family)
MTSSMNVTDDDNVVQAGSSLANQEPKRRNRGTWAIAAVLAVIGLAAIGAIFAGRALYSALKPTPALEIAADASESERLEKIDLWLLELQQSGEFNGGVLIARDGEPLLMKTYGYADSDATRLLTDRTPFRLASVSKQFTAAGILRLVENGQVDLDQPVSNYLQDFPFASVTIRHLLNQTSGIPDVYMDLAKQHRKELGDVLRIKDVADLIRRYPPKAKAPGNEYEYSNTNYVLLAAAIESVSGMTYEDFMQEELFEPLGMQDTRVWNRVSTKQSFPERAEDFYSVFGMREPLPMTWIDGVAGDGAVFCSLRDFLIWDEFWSGNSLVSDDLLSQAFVRPKLNDGSPSHYGFGWVIARQPGRAWHNGAWLGARTYIIRDAASKRCLAVLDNSQNERAATIASSIERQLFRSSARHGVAPRVSPFTEVRFDDEQVIVTYDRCVHRCHPSIFDIQSFSAGQGEQGTDRHRRILWAVCRTPNARSSFRPHQRNGINTRFGSSNLVRGGCQPARAGFND